MVNAAHPTLERYLDGAGLLSAHKTAPRKGITMIQKPGIHLGATAFWSLVGLLMWVGIIYLVFLVLGVVR